MAAYLEKAKELMGMFPTASIKVILRSKNINANALAKLTSTRDAKLLHTVTVQFLAEPSIKQQLEVMALTKEPLWMDPIITYLKNDELPEGRRELTSFG